MHVGPGGTTSCLRRSDLPVDGRRYDLPRLGRLDGSTSSICSAASAPTPSRSPARRRSTRPRLLAAALLPDSSQRRATSLRRRRRVEPETARRAPIRLSSTRASARSAGCRAYRRWARPSPAAAAGRPAVHARGQPVLWSMPIRGRRAARRELPVLRDRAASSSRGDRCDARRRRPSVTPASVELQPRRRRDLHRATRCRTSSTTAPEEHCEVPWNPLGDAMLASPDAPGEFVLAEGRDRCRCTLSRTRPPVWLPNPRA